MTFGSKWPVLVSFQRRLEGKVRSLTIKCSSNRVTCPWSYGRCALIPVKKWFTSQFWVWPPNQRSLPEDIHLLTQQICIEHLSHARCRGEILVRCSPCPQRAYSLERQTLWERTSLSKGKLITWVCLAQKASSRSCQYGPGSQGRTQVSSSQITRHHG